MSVFVGLILILFDIISAQNYVFSRTFWPKNNYDADAVPSCMDYVDLKITIQDGSDMAIFNIETNRLNTWIGLWFPSDDANGAYFDTTQNVTDGYAIIIEKAPFAVNEYTCMNINCNIQTTQNLMSINSTEINNISYVSFERALDTSDINDFVIRNPSHYLTPSCNPILITVGYGLNTEGLLFNSTNYDYVHSFVYMYDESIMNNMEFAGDFTFDKIEITPNTTGLTEVMNNADLSAEFNVTIEFSINDDNITFNVLQDYPSAYFNDWQGISFFEDRQMESKYNIFNLSKMKNYYGAYLIRNDIVQGFTPLCPPNDAVQEISWIDGASCAAEPKINLFPTFEGGSDCAKILGQQNVLDTSESIIDGLNSWNFTIPIKSCGYHFNKWEYLTCRPQIWAYAKKEPVSAALETCRNMINSVTGDHYFNYIETLSVPTPEPTTTPSMTPSIPPTATPSMIPSMTPTMTPSETPTETPTETPSMTPSMSPSMTPSRPPTKAPSMTPTEQPTPAPTFPIVKYTIESKIEFNISGNIPETVIIDIFIDLDQNMTININGPYKYLYSIFFSNTDIFGSIINADPIKLGLLFDAQVPGYIIIPYLTPSNVNFVYEIKTNVSMDNGITYSPLSTPFNSFITDFMTDDSTFTSFVINRKQSNMDDPINDFDFLDFSNLVNPIYLCNYANVADFTSNNPVNETTPQNIAPFLRSCLPNDNSCFGCNELQFNGNYQIETEYTWTINDNETVTFSLIYDPFEPKVIGKIIKPKNRWLIIGSFYEGSSDVGNPFANSYFFSAENTSPDSSKVISVSSTPIPSGDFQLSPLGGEYMQSANDIDNDTHIITFNGTESLDMRDLGWDSIRFLKTIEITVDLIHAIPGKNNLPPLNPDFENNEVGLIYNTTLILQYNTDAPTMSPSVSPTLSPSLTPTLTPTLSPSLTPTLTPTLSPSVTPTLAPTLSPSVTPTTTPTMNPSIEPTTSPSISPVKSTLMPSTNPTMPSQEGSNESNANLYKHILYAFIILFLFIFEM